MGNISGSISLNTNSAEGGVEEPQPASTRVGTNRGVNMQWEQSHDHSQRTVVEGEEFGWVASERFEDILEVATTGGRMTAVNKKV